MIFDSNPTSRTMPMVPLFIYNRSDTVVGYSFDSKSLIFSAVATADCIS